MRVTPSQNQQIGFSIIGLAEGATGYAPEEFESVTDLRADLGAALDHQARLQPRLGGAPLLSNR